MILVFSSHSCDIISYLSEERLVWELGWPVTLVESKRSCAMGWGSLPLPPPPFDPVPAPKTGGGFSREHAAGITRAVFSSKRIDVMKLL